MLATDGIKSYVFFLYDKLEWTNTDTDSVTAAKELPQVITYFSGNGTMLHFAEGRLQLHDFSGMG